MARLLHERGAVALGAVVARDSKHVADAIAFVRAGSASSIQGLPPAQLTLIATPDDAIETVVRQLTQHAWRPGDIAFHCSGALSSSVLAPLAERGVAVASVHPLKSFADPAVAIRNFRDTWCACEGDSAALAVLGPLFDAVGARRFTVEAQGKTLYHAAAVLASNDLVALMEAALRCMAAAGVAQEQAWPALRTLVDGTLDNLDSMPPREALTGPVARGDLGTVARQLQAVETLDADIAASYRALGRVALSLALLDDAGRAALGEMLGGKP